MTKKDLKKRSRKGLINDALFYKDIADDLTDENVNLSLELSEAKDKIKELEEEALFYKSLKDKTQENVKFILELDRANKRIKELEDRDELNEFKKCILENEVDERDIVIEYLESKVFKG